MGPTEPRSTVLTPEQERMLVAFRRHTLLPLDDCLYALQPSIPHLTRSTLHRCLERHGVSRLPSVDGDKPARRKFNSYPIGYVHIDAAEVSTGPGKLRLFAGIDRTSKFAFVRLVESAGKVEAAQFFRDPTLRSRLRHQGHIRDHQRPFLVADVRRSRLAMQSGGTSGSIKPAPRESA